VSALPSTTVLYAASSHCIYCANLAEESQSQSVNSNDSGFAYGNCITESQLVHVCVAYS